MFLFISTLATQPPRPPLHQFQKDTSGGKGARSSDSNKKEYKVEKILKVEPRGRAYVYLVKWEGYDSDDDDATSWEPMNCLIGAASETILRGAV